MHSIRTRITAITIAAILTSILAVISAVFFTFDSENVRNSTQMMNMLCQKTELSIEEYLRSIEQSMGMETHIVSDSLDSIRLVKGGAAGGRAKDSEKTAEQEQELDSYLEEYCNEIKKTLSSVVSHTQGVVAYYFCIPPEISKNQHGFYFARVGRTGFDEKEPLDAAGLDPEDMEHNCWYFTAIQRGRPSWIGPYQDTYLGDEVISYITPIYSAGTLVALLGMDILFDTLVSQIRAVRLYENGYAFLCDEKGNILYHPELERGSEPEADIKEDIGKIFEQESNGDELIRYSYKGEPWQMAFTTLSSGMKLGVTAPVSEIRESWQRLSKIILMITSVIILVFSVIIIFAMSRITRPLKLLTSASKRLADGDYDVELSSKGQDEISSLTKAFSQMRDHIKQYISDLNRRISTDDLTGLPSRAYFFKHAERNREHMQQEGRSTMILFFDLVGMKHFNRQYSFEEGDRLICSVADIIAGYFGEKRCCRFGQDHFTAISEEEGLEDKIRAFFRDCEKANEGRSLPVRVGVYPDILEKVGVGVACDRAKYACDRHRGSFVSEIYYFDSGMLELAENQRYIINSLDRALEEGWVRVFYQPIIRAVSGEICDEEALSRWFDPERGLIPPGQFIPVLEDARLIYKVDLYVLDQILLKIKSRKEEGLCLVPQSLNLSRMDFDSCDIVEEVCRRVDRAGIARDMLTIEITESTVGSDFDFIKEQVERFRNLGFSVWMDDFGSGYSSLDVLQDIHFDLIKFDMRFMHRFGEGDANRIILTQLMKMAIELGIETVTEGVETKEQADFLREIGCTRLQGYYYSRPLPYEEILEKSREGKYIPYEKPFRKT